MRVFLLFVTSLFFTNAFTQLFIKNTNIIDIERKKILAGYDVMVADGKIISVDKGKKHKPTEGSKVIDGTGKYLMPGLTDAHIHFFQSGGLDARPDAIDLRKHQPYIKEIRWVHDNMEDFARRYTSAGITSVIDVGATFNFLSQKDSFAHKSYAPLISITGPLLTTWMPEVYKNLGNDAPFIEMKDEESIRQAVKDQLDFKADFIKIWYIVLDSNIERGARKNLPLVQAAIDEAHKNKMRVAVHATERITAQLAVEAGADFLVHNIDNEIVNEDFVQLLKKRNTVICPTLIVNNGYFNTLSNTYTFHTDDLNLANPVTAGSIINYPWPDSSLAKKYMQRLSIPAVKASIAMEDSIAVINLKKLLNGGVIIATGTDAGNIGTQHAASYFSELKAMQQAGFSNWQLLEASTINGAKAAGREKVWGSITKDKLANMVLLNANPLDSIENIKKIYKVINKGKLLSPDSLIKNTPEMLAQQQLNAYNAHNLEAFLTPYAEDVQVFRFPEQQEIKGKEAMRKAYGFIEKTPTLYCKLLNRIVQGNMVIDHEEVWGFGNKPFYGIAIYVIENGKISKVYFPQ